MKAYRKITAVILAVAFAGGTTTMPVMAEENFNKGVRASVEFSGRDGKALEASISSIQKMTDENMLTSYSSPIGTENGTYTFDLYGLQWINRVYIKEINNTIQKYSLYVSSTGSGWKKVYSGTQIGPYAKNINFEPQKARYVQLRVEKTDNDFSDAVIGIVEFGIYTSRELVHEDLKNSIYLAKQKLNLIRSETMKHHYDKEIDEKFSKSIEQAEKIYAQSSSQTEIDNTRDMLDALVSEYETNLVPTKEDYEIIKERYIETWVGNTLEYNEARKKTIESLENEVQGYLDTMIKNPTIELWEEFIPTRANPASEGAKINETVFKFKKMARAYCQEHNKFYKSEEIVDTILKGIDWVLTNKYNENVKEYGNWWSWTVSTPTELTETLMMLGDKVPQELIDRSERAIDERIDKDFHITWSGTNRLYLATIRLKFATVTQKPLDIHKVKYSLAQEVGWRDKVLSGVPGDGLHWDGSFMYHSGILYNASYGRDQIANTMGYIATLYGTPWQVEQYIIDNLAEKMGTGFEDILYNGMVVEVTAGRSVGMGVSQGSTISSTIGQVGEYAAEPYKSIFKGIAKETLIHNKDTKNALVTDEDVVPRGRLTKLKRYPVGTKVVLQTPEYGLGLGMFGARTKTFEAPNGDAMKAWYVSSGTTFVLNEDRTQYDRNYWVAVDHYRLPGITVDKIPRTIVRFQGEMYNSHDWCGSVAMDEKTGVAGMEINNYDSNVYGRKSWFMFDDEIVCVGSDISGGTENIETVVDNRKILKDNSNILEINGEATTGDFAEKEVNAKTVFLSGNTETGSDMGYYFPGGADVKILRGEHSGKEADMWLSDSKKEISENFVTVWYDHGKSPKSAGYGYVLIPGATPEKLASYSENPDIEIISTGDVHVARDNSIGQTGYAFWTANGGEADGIKANGKVVMMKKENDYGVQFNIADPTVVSSKTVTIKTDKNFEELISADEAIDVKSIAPLEFTVDFAGLEGREVTLKVSKTKTGFSANDTNDVLVMKAGDNRILSDSFVTEKADIITEENGQLMYFIPHIADEFGYRYSETDNIAQIISDKVIKLYNDGTVKKDGETVKIRGAKWSRTENGVYVNARLLAEITGGRVVENGNRAAVDKSGKISESKLNQIIESVSGYIKWEA